MYELEERSKLKRFFLQGKEVEMMKKRIIPRVRKFHSVTPSPKTEKNLENPPPTIFSKISKFFKNFFAIFIIVLVFSMFAVIVWESLKNKTIVESFEVPKDLIDIGYTKEALIGKIGDHICDINQAIKFIEIKEKDPLPIELSSEVTHPSLEIPGTGIHITSLASFFRNSIGINQKKIKAEFIIDKMQKKDKTKLRFRFTLRVCNNDSYPFYEKIDIPKIGEKMYSTEEMDKAMKEAAIHIARYIKPYQAGIYFISKKEYKKVGPIIDSLIKKKNNRDQFNGYLLKGKLHYNTENNKNIALEIYKRALKIAPDKKGEALACSRLGIVLATIGKFEEATKYFKNATEYEPKSAKNHLNLGLALSLEKNYHEAIDAFEKAIKIDNTFTEAYYYIGVNLTKIGKLQEAINSLSKALGLEPEHALIRIAIVKVYIKLGNKKDACKKLNELLKTKERINGLKNYIEGLIKNKEFNFLEKLLECIKAPVPGDPPFEDVLYRAEVEIKNHKKKLQAVVNNLLLKNPAFQSIQNYLKALPILVKQKNIEWNYVQREKD